MTEETALEAQPSVEADEVCSRLLELVGGKPELDLAAVYRGLVARFGAHAVPQISEGIATLIRQGRILIETRRDGPFSPLVGYARCAEGAPRR